MSVADIESEMQEIYGINLSLPPLSPLSPLKKEGPNRVAKSSFDSLYMIVWMDGTVFSKVRENGKVINKTVYPRWSQ